MQPGYSVSWLVAWQYAIVPGQLLNRERLINSVGQSAIFAGDEVVSVAEVKVLEKKIYGRSPALVHPPYASFHPIRFLLRLPDLISLPAVWCK